MNSNQIVEAINKWNSRSGRSATHVLISNKNFRSILKEIHQMTFTSHLIDGTQVIKIDNCKILFDHSIQDDTIEVLTSKTSM